MEMLGVVVIMGIILIVVIPSMSKMVHDNNNQELSNYYILVEEAAQSYAAKLTNKLGNSKYTGCAEITLDELIDNGYVQKFNNQNVTCKTGTGNIKIRNNKGAITVNFQLSCSEDGEDVYVTGKNDNSTCEPYVMETKTNIKTVLESDDSIKKVNISNDVYITGEDPNNHIWYSGRLWRVVSYNAATEVVKMVTYNPMTSIYYSSSNSNSSMYSGSDVETWINNEFLNSLKDKNKFLSDSTWNTTPNTSIVNNPTNGKVIKAKAGLLSTFDYGKISSGYGTNETWLLSEGTSGNSLYTASGAINKTSSKTILAIRPVISVSSDVIVHSGSGTRSSPYIIDNSSNAFGKPGEYINTRFSGEFVKIGTNTYRIVSNEGGILKVIGTHKIGNYAFSDNHFDYSSSSLRTTLESKLKQEMIFAVSGDFCLDTINGSSPMYLSPRCLVPSRINNSIMIGLPKVGDLFTTKLPHVTENYWTLNPNTEIDGNGNHYGATMNLVSETGRVTTSTISTSNATVVVLYINSNAKIVSGIGIYSSPYVITL